MLASLCGAFACFSCKYGLIFADVCSRGSILAEENSILKNFEKTLEKNFQNRERPNVCTFGQTFTPFHFIMMPKLEKG